MITSSSFEEEYQKLNKNQQFAVDSIEGPVMVMAGPGTGKTQVLTLRIANILKKTDTSPSSILALTFTDAASNEMRQRLVKLIGQPAYSVQIYTFHSFCQSVILENPDLFIVAEETEHLQDLDRTKILQKIILGNEFLLLKPLNAPFYYCQSIIEKIRTIKREGISPKEFKQTLNKQKKFLKTQADSLSKTALAVAEKDLNKNIDLQKIYFLYQQELVNKGRFDFEDMINWVVDRFEQDPNLLLSYQERLSYFLVDEYQDTNSSQNQLVFNLASFWAEKANMFVVGDPNQSIFRFQGASLENTKEFISRFPNTTLINLNQNYRSPQIILDSAHSVIKNNSPKAVKLKSNITSLGKPISVASFSHSIFEDYYLAKTVENLIKKNTSPQNIAVIVRYNKDLDDLSSTFKKFNLPFTVQGTQDLLEQPLIKKIILFLTIINNSPHKHLDTEIFTLLNLDFFTINPLSILKTAKNASHEHTHIVSYVLSTKHKVPLGIKRFVKNLNKWQILSANLTLPEFFEKLIQQSGILDHLLKQKNKANQLSILNMFFTQIKNMAFNDKGLNLSGFLKNIESLKEQKVKTTFISPISIKESVTLTTAHKAKGLEWDHVFLYRVTDGKWSNARTRELIKLPNNLLEFTDIQNPQEEERRLFYVALTRAKKALYLTTANQYTTDYGIQNTLPSSFICEIPKKLTIKISPQKTESNSTIVVKKLLIPPINSTTTKEKEYLAGLVKDIKLSVTALTTFLDCAYKFKLNNIYRLPKAKEAYLVFGTAVHTALEKYFLKPSLNILLSQFKKALKKEVLTPEDYSARLKHGISVLTAYHNLHSTNLKPVYALEKYFGYSSSSNCRLGDIPLIGKVDKIDILDQDKKLAKIIDFKTGKPKTIGEIEGTTQNSTGYLKRQLVFYALLAKLDKNFPYKVTQFELDFVESPFLNGKSGQTTFTVSEKEIEKLKVEIKDTVEKIRSLKFPRTKDTSPCHLCEFKDHCHPQGIPRAIL